MTLNQEQLVSYFQRIGLHYEDYANHKLDSKLLEKLCFAHNITIPFENLDILAGKPLRLDGASLYEKIIANRRGGLCFELNGLSAIFYALWVSEYKIFFLDFFVMHAGKFLCKDIVC